jgi:hypothetical protein
LPRPLQPYLKLSGAHALREDTIAKAGMQTAAEHKGGGADKGSGARGKQPSKR